MPIIPPFQENNIDAAYIMQVQFQLHATGADYGYLVSWARRGLSIFKVPYSLDLVRATAVVLRYVIGEYLSPEDIPQLPARISELPQDVQDAVAKLHTQLGTVMGQCERLSLTGVVLTEQTYGP